jgi:hypothetical protein
MEQVFEIGQIVYLKTDLDQMPRMVTGILNRSNYKIYYLSQATNETMHYHYEISVEVNEIIKMLN